MNLSTVNVPIYWINLDTENGRREHMESLIGNLPNTRISALTPNDIMKYAQINSLTRVELAVFLSHVLAIETFIRISDSSNTVALICEDDVALDYFPYVPFGTWNAFMNTLPPFDIIQLAVTSEHNHHVTLEAHKPYEFCACAYLITKDYAKRYIDHIRSFGTDLRKLVNLARADVYVYEYADLVYSIPLFTYNLAYDKQNCVSREQSHNQFHVASKNQILEKYTAALDRHAMIRTIINSSKINNKLDTFPIHDLIKTEQISCIRILQNPAQFYCMGNQICTLAISSDRVAPILRIVSRLSSFITSNAADRINFTQPSIMPDVAKYRSQRINAYHPRYIDNDYRLTDHLDTDMFIIRGSLLHAICMRQLMKSNSNSNSNSGVDVTIRINKIYSLANELSSHGLTVSNGFCPIDRPIKVAVLTNVIC